MKKKSIFVAAAVLAMCAFIAWLCGYNFDYRGPDVACGFAFSLWLACFCAAIIEGLL